MNRMGKYVLLLVTAVSLVFAGTVRAQPVSGVNVYLSPGGYVTASWYNPYSVEPTAIEVASTTTSDTYGFLIGTQIFDLLTSYQTTYVSSYPLPYGTWYVRIDSIDIDCFYAGLCPVMEYSPIQVLTYSAPAPDPAPPEYVPPSYSDEQSGSTTLTLREAKIYTRRAIKKRMGSNPKHLKRACKRWSKTKIRCRVRWITKIKKYKGRMTIWTKYIKSKDAEYWSYKFRGTSKKKRCSKRCIRKVRWG